MESTFQSTKNRGFPRKRAENPSTSTFTRSEVPKTFFSFRMRSQKSYARVLFEPTTHCARSEVHER